MAAIADGNLVEMTLDANAAERASRWPRPCRPLLEQRRLAAAGRSVGRPSRSGPARSPACGSESPAKVFAYAVGADVLGISTLEAIAANMDAGDGLDRRLSAVTRALTSSSTPRGEVVVQSFARQPDGRFEPLGREELLRSPTAGSPGRTS